MNRSVLSLTMRPRYNTYKRYSFFIGCTCLISVLLIYHYQSSLLSNDSLTTKSKRSDILDYDQILSKKIKDLNSVNIDSNNINQDLDALESMKKNLIIMRKFLGANNFSKSQTDEAVPDFNNNLFDKEQYFKSKKILEENAETFLDIADFLEKVGFSRHHDPEIIRVPDSENNEQEQQKMRIKDWDAIYVNFDDGGAIKDHRQQSQIQYLKNKLKDWDLFYVKFPDEQSQDAILRHFELSQEIVEELVSTMNKFEATMHQVDIPAATYLNIYDSEETVSWKLLHQHITQYKLYNPDDPVFKQVLQEMVTMPLIENYEPTGGTQQKLVFYLTNDLRLIFKPMRFPRKQEALPDHMFWRDYERHFAEIASFHLDMVLGFHRVPPTIGRYVNVTREIQDLDFKKSLTFFKSPAGNKCFYGKCDYYCDTAHAVCGRPDMIEGSFMMYLPTSKQATRISWRHPWRRTYSKTTKKAAWEKDYNYCSDIKLIPPYNSGRRLLDLMDMAVFDFLSGNMDRHHYETFEDFGNYTAPILFDNGRGFGKSGHDELTILAPIYQCCKMRYSTLKKLLSFHQGPLQISDVMRQSMASDHAKPVLLEHHLKAMDRRLSMILRTVHKCISSHSFVEVVVDDGF